MQTALCVGLREGERQAEEGAGGIKRESVGGRLDLERERIKIGYWSFCVLYLWIIFCSMYFG